MKRNYLIASLTLGICLFTASEAITNSSGAPQGTTGSPASNNNTCGRSGCHSGPAQSTETITISTDIPASGFQENTTYTITVKANDGGRNLNRMGFEASVEDASSTGHAGTLSVTNSSETRLTGNYITHRFAGTSPSNGEKSWSFDWNSATAADQTTVYVAVNFANGNSTTSGDVIATETLVLNKANNISLSTQKASQLSLYPNPARAQLTFATAERVEAPLQIFDQAGKLQAKIGEEYRLDDSHWQFSTEALPPGQYILKTPAGEHIAFQKI